MRDCPRKKYSDERKKREQKEQFQSRERQRKESIRGKDEAEDRTERHEKLQSPNSEKIAQPNTNLKPGKFVFIM